MSAWETGEQTAVSNSPTPSSEIVREIGPTPKCGCSVGEFTHFPHLFFRAHVEPQTDWHNCGGNY